MPRWLTALAYLAVFAVGILRADTLLEPQMIEWSDVMADRVTAEAAVDGTGIDQPLSQLMKRHNLTYYDQNVIAPRPPGAVIAALPTLAVPVPLLLATAAVVNVAAIAYIGWASTRIAGISAAWGVVVAALYFTPFMHEVVRWGNNACLIAALVVAAWMTERTKPVAAGGLLGAAAAIKLWPALLVFVISRRAKTATVLTASGVTLAGLLLPGVTLAAMGGLNSNELWLTSGFNHSLAAVFARRGIPGSVLIGAAIGAAIWFLCLRLAGSTDGRIGVTVLAALLISPYSWAPYWLAVVPAIFVIARRLNQVIWNTPPAAGVNKYNPDSDNPTSGHPKAANAPTTPNSPAGYRP